MCSFSQIVKLKLLLMGFPLALNGIYTPRLSLA